MGETIDIDTAAVLVAVSTRIKDNRVVGNKKLEDDLTYTKAQFSDDSCDKEKFYELINKYLDELTSYSKEHKSEDNTCDILLCDPVPQWVKDMFKERYGLKLVDNVE